MLTLRDESVNKLNAIFTELVGRTDGLTEKEQKIHDFYLSGIQNEMTTQAGLSALYEDLNVVGSVQNTKDFISVIARMHRRGIGVLFDIGVMPDKKDSGTYALYMGQSGLGLPDREYYLSNNSHYAAIREKYAEHIRKPLY